MSTSQRLYTDGFFEIYMSNGVVHMACGNMPFRHQDDSEEPEPEVTARIAMTPLGFAGSFERMQKMMDVLIEKGVLQKRPDEQIDPVGS